MKLEMTQTQMPGSLPADLTNGVLTVRCPECGRDFRKCLTEKEEANVLMLYECGGFHPDGHVQDVFPNWPPETRELFLQSHMCNDCWTEMFGVEG